MAKETASLHAQSVLLAHPNRLIRESLAAVLQGDGFQVIGQAEDEPSLRRLAVQQKPDIILLDWEISEVRVDAVRGLADDVPGAIVVILTRPQPSETFVEAIDPGDETPWRPSSAWMGKRRHILCDYRRAGGKSR